MSEKTTNDKLVSKLDIKEILKTSNKFKLKFTDFAISNYQSSYHKTDKDGNIIGVKENTYTPFDSTKNTYLKGLKLRQFRRSNKKYFVLQIWYESKASYIPIGEFIPDKFGVRQCEEKVFELFKAHTNDKGYWIRNPRLTINSQSDEERRAIVEDSLKLSIREVIERLCKANFPRSKREGRLSASSIQSACKTLIGYNWRTHHLIFVEDYNGHGLVRFKANRTKRTAKPVDWDDLFKKFPTGKGTIKDVKFNPNGEHSVYDDPIGGEKIDSLTPGLIKRFIERNDKGFGTKKNMLEAFKCLWSFAVDKGYLGDNIPNNPTMKVKFKRPEIANSPGTKYNDRRFTDDELKTIHSELVKLSSKETSTYLSKRTNKIVGFPFQAEALLFLLCTGRRAEETLKIRRSMINKERTLITLPSSITKARKVEYVDITPPVKFVLDMLDRKLQGEFQRFRFVDWLFPTTRINKDRLHEDRYVRSDLTRCKELRGCWTALVRQTGIEGAPKMLRKTFSSIAKMTLGTSSKARVLTGHEQDSTLDIHYDKHTTQQRKEYASKVANFFEFKKVENE